MPNYAAAMKSGQAVDALVAISRGTRSPFASPSRRRRTAGPFMRTLTQGVGGGRTRRRMRAFGEFEAFAPLFSVN